ncbi:MAG: DUF3078 domain-containing protein [Flavobacteriaceae bacterium]|mgnify:FL=1|nr:DUF3078 domain-containing protein [Flavobacteriaceae bacterium]CAI8349436.1 MAG: Uncharacterised protein [Flavobacteriaceae bacterium]|tara:strand:+ start:35 stop:952 length:918 start_codon:yes stop_codon:yes gene_type:complete
MNKVLLLLLNIIISTNSLSQAVVTDSLKQEGWNKSGKITFLVNQSAFSNWTSGGENSIAGALSLDYNLNYLKNGWAWDTKMIGAFGMNKNSDSEFAKKTDDRIEINSLVGKKFTKELSYSSFLNFKTQFARGYKYSTNSLGLEEREETTRFFSPAYIQLGVGVYWKKTKDFWINMAPVTGRLIIANRKFTSNLIDGAEYFGISKGNTSRFELGASLSGFYKFELIENVILEQSLSLYSDYLQNAENIDVDYTVSAFMKINDYLSTTLIMQCRYDDNAIKKVQLREVFGLAITLDLLEIPSIISKI